MLNYEVGHVVVLEQNNLILGSKCCGRQAQSPTEEIVLVQRLEFFLRIELLYTFEDL